VLKATRQPDNPAPNVEASNGEHVEFAELWTPSEGQPTWRGPERLLLDSGQITLEQLDKARQRLTDNPRLTVLQALVLGGDIDDVTALKALAEYFHQPFKRVASAEVDPDVFALLPLDYLKAKHILPIRRAEEGIVVAITDPADIFLIEDIKRRLRTRVHFAVAPQADIQRAVEDLTVNPSQQVEEIIKDIQDDTVEVVEVKAEEVTDLEKIAGESPVIRYANYLISQAVKDGASDIHIEPGEKRLRVRYRVDGILFDQQAPPLQMHAAIISRLKIMANLDIAERRLPQDGRIRASVHGRNVDLRISILPIIHGEKCVIRILDNRSIMVGLEQLGMLEDTLEAFRHEILQPHGVVLVTGPTGSGKSTTLYSALQVMDSTRMNISTVEDPVEYELATVNQVHVHDKIGMSFSAALRSLLRQDPDVIMLGEIRDEETARIAVQASLTGHLVLSTLHTNDAPSSITRLINIGVEPYLISAAVNAVLAQRLVRRICPNCKAPVSELPTTEQAYLKRIGVQLDAVFRGAGCEKCRQTGYKGRVGIYEFLELTDEVRDITSRGPTLNELRHAARDSGMRTLREDGLQKVASGQTTIEEIMRVTET